MILSLPSTGQALLAVVALNSTVSLIQNYKVEKLMVSFFDYIPKEVVLLRDGQRVPLDAKEVSNWDSRQNWEGWTGNWPWACPRFSIGPDVAVALVLLVNL